MPNNMPERPVVRVKVDPTFEAAFKDVLPEEYQLYKEKEKETKKKEAHESRSYFIKKFGLVLIACLIGLFFFIAILLPAGSALVKNLNFFDLNSGKETSSMFEDMPSFHLGEDIALQLTSMSNAVGEASKEFKDFGGKLNEDSWDARAKTSE